MPIRTASVLMASALTVAGCAGDPLENDRLVYTAIGASDAFGIGAAPLSHGYVFRIESALEDRDREIALVNLGIPNAHARRINEAVGIFLESGVDADLVTVWVGANDLVDGVEPAEFEIELEQLLNRVEGDANGFVVIANLPDLPRLPRFIDAPDGDVTRERIEAFNAIIEDEADERDIPVVDLFAQDVESDLVADIDGFHPTHEGHQRIAQHFLDVILDEI